MSMVKVWNENKYEHVEMFKGKEIRLAPGIENAIEMDYIEACEFQGQFTPPAHKEDPRPERRFKMIRVEHPKEPVIKDDNIIHATGQRASSAQEIAEVIRELRKGDAQQDPTKDVEMAAMKEQLAKQSLLIDQLLAQQAKKPGPKGKAKSA